jgi:hypothetical protein
MNDYTQWTSGSAPNDIPTIANETSLTRNVNFYEDEDETSSPASVKFSSVGSTTGYAESTITSTDLSNFDYITAWVYATGSGNLIKFGFGESAGTEQEENVYIDSANTWQKVYWDITDIDQSLRNQVTKLRISILSTNTTLYVDKITADRYLNTSSGSTITSTPNDYIQYRAILTSTNQGYRPKLHNVVIEWNNGFKIVQTDANTVRLFNFTGETQQLRLDAIVFGADLAEWYTVDDETIEPGDVVAITGNLDEYSVPILRKAKTINDEGLIGVISTKAGQSLGVEAPNRRLLALAGRVPVKIDPDSAAIAAGDYLTSSSVAGYARKATPDDIAIGKALENWHPSLGKQTILVMVQNSPSRNYSIADGKAFIMAKNALTNAWELIDEETGEAVKRLGAFAELVVANIKAGAITTSELTVNGLQTTAKLITESLESVSAVVDSLIANSQIVSPVIETKTISPLADSDITINLENTATDSATPTYGKLVVKGEEGKEVSSFDAFGNASFSGELTADRLQTTAIQSDTVVSRQLTVGKLFADEIVSKTGTFADLVSASSSGITREEVEELLRQAQEDQQTLAANTNSDIFTATSSADLATVYTLQTTDLYVTNQAAINSLSLSSSLSIGTDMVISSAVDSSQLAVSSINTLSAPLQIQSLALAPVELMAGKMRIETNGDVVINGNLFVAGTIESSGLTLKPDVTRPGLVNGFGELLNLQNVEGQKVATIDASGSARFKTLQTEGLVIAGAQNATPSAAVNGIIETNATAGKAIIPTETAEITIKNPKITDYTLVYVTPTSTTLNNVLYVKSKGAGYFTVGFSQPLLIDVEFNWWVIDVANQIQN